jgi:hypothetical protein
MTSHRTLKKLVRDRMARTGESDTTAHRHVTAGRAPATGHRESALVRRMLASNDVAVTESMACGLGGGIGFMYAVFEYAAVPHPLLTVVTQHHPTPWVEAVADHVGLRLATVGSSRVETALGKLERILDDGTAAWIVVARGHLPWHDDVSPLEAADPCAVVAVGHDGDEVTVLDQEEHRVDRTVLGRAWAAHRKGRFRITTFEPAGRLDLAAAADRAVRTTHRHLTGPVLGNSFDGNFGLGGMRRLRDDLADPSTKRGWRRRFGPAPEYGLGRLADCLTWAYGAPGATRTAYAGFLAEIGRHDEAGLAREAGRQWAAMADLAATAEAADPAATFAQLADRVDAVIAVEEELATALGR